MSWIFGVWRVYPQRAHLGERKELNVTGKPFTRAALYYYYDHCILPSQYMRCPRWCARPCCQRVRRGLATVSWWHVHVDKEPNHTARTIYFSTYLWIYHTVEFHKWLEARSILCNILYCCYIVQGANKTSVLLLRNFVAIYYIQLCAISNSALFTSKIQLRYIYRFLLGVGWTYPLLLRYLMLPVCFCT